jgi:hypothetical protein
MKRTYNFLLAALLFVALALATVVIGLLAKDVNDLPAWVQAVFSVVAIATAIWIMKFQHDEARVAAISAQRDRTRYVLTAIQSELDVFPDPLIEMTTDRFASWPTIEITFPVYESCAGEIGNVDDQYLRHRVIAAYAGIRSLLAGINSYSTLAQHFVEQENISPSLGKREQSMWAQLYQNARDIYKDLKEVDELLKVAIDKLNQPR